MIKISVTNRYRKRVEELYGQISQEGWSNLKRFEMLYRKIHILNGKIKCRAADYEKQEGEYSVY